jgi:4-carboxymuconolactone decarboxylase
MPRLAGVESQDAGLFTRLIYWFVRRGIGALTGQARLVEPIKITAHHPRLLRAYGEMERGQAAAQSVPANLKTLASIKTAMLVGCPF